MNSSNISIVLALYQEVLGNRNTELAQQLIAEDYIQHNPMVKTGRAGVLEAIEYLKQFPTPPLPKESPIKRIFEDGDFVFVHLIVSFGNQTQVVMDLFRIEEGKLAEHWDGIQLAVSETKNGHSMVDGETEIHDLELSDSNKQLISGFHQQVLVDKKLDHLAAFVSEDLVQHHPAIDNGRQGLEAFLQNHQEKLQLEAPARIKGSGNFVVSQSKATIEDAPHVVYVLYRLDQGKIVEMWQVQQAIPEQMAHGNGMI